MSRTYHMKISVLLPSRNDELIAAIYSAVNKYWPIDGSDEILLNDGTVQYVLDWVGSLTGGERDDEFAAKVAYVIWNACGGYVPVEVAVTYLGDCDTHSRPSALRSRKKSCKKPSKKRARK